MKLHCVIATAVSMLVLASCLFAAEKPVIRMVGDKDIPEFLNAAVPSEYAEFVRVQAGKDELAVCKAAIKLVDKVYQQQQEQPRKVSMNKPSGIVELMAWKLVLKTNKSVSSSEGKVLIRKAWHKYLALDREDRSPQLLALTFDWDPSLMTDESIEVFKTTLDPMTVRGFACVFMDHGEDKELALLKDKLASVEANLKGQEPAYSVASNNIQMAIDSIESWKYRGLRVPKPPRYYRK